ncbi:hypothetical protein FRB90_003057 [Tulasnella sp. 427]|nr:hypothetical protein FRB90_003057 [Tulasnella sp. 427]
MRFPFRHKYKCSNDYTPFSALKESALEKAWDVESAKEIPYNYASDYQMEKTDAESLYMFKRTLTVDMGPSSSPVLGSISEEQEEGRDEEEEPICTKAYALRLAALLLLLFTVLMVGSSAGYLPPRGGMSVDTRVKWSVRGVSREMRESGTVPWWKVAIVSLNVDVDVVAGKKKKTVIGGGKETIGNDGQGPEVAGRNAGADDGEEVVDFERSQSAMMERYPRFHKIL